MFQRRGRPSPVAKRRFAVFTASTMATVVAGQLVSAVAAAPAHAIPIPGRYYQHEVRSVSEEHGIGQWKSIMKVLPSGTRLNTVYSEKFSESYAASITTTLNAEAAVKFATGASAEAGGGFTLPTVGDVEAKVTGDVSAEATGKASYTTSTTTSLTYGTEFTVTVTPPQEVRKGFQIYMAFIGRTYNLRQRHCDTNLLGDDPCGPWTNYTMRVPHGIQLRTQGLGWTASTFGAGGTTKWATHPHHQGATICGGIPLGLMLDAATNTYTLSCWSSTLAQGKFIVKNEQDNAVYDVDSFTAVFRTGPLSGRVQVVREKVEPGNTYRPVTMNSTGAITHTLEKATFRIVNWTG